MTPPTLADLRVLELPPALSRAISSGHPWIYRDHVPRGFDAPTGTFVRIRCGALSAVALWDATSPLALRIFSRNEVPGPGFVDARVRDALRLREVTGVTGRATAYRWINGEGDRLPGVTVDRYGGFAVMTTDGPAIEPLVPWVVTALGASANLQGIVRKIRGAAESERLEVLAGRLPPRDLIVEEHGLRFRANLHQGQKTGLFLDQRDNRKTIETLSAERRVLNLFGYTGGFSVCAARGGASGVTTVDIAEGAIDDARENFRLNGFDVDAHEFFAEDVFEYLKRAAEQSERFDVVVCDPPSFARSRAHRDRALKAYIRLHTLALAVVSEGGLYAASSCTTQVGVDAFRDTLAQASRKARKALPIVHDTGHAADHPIAVGHPEGRYLKFMVGRVTTEG